MNSILSNSQKNNSLLSPKLDVVFQALFGEVGSENITSKFLEAILNQKIDSIDLSKNPILRREYLEDKLGILDIVAKINNCENCNIEMQLTNKDKIIERLLHYWGRQYSRDLHSGDDYDVLQKTIIILIADFYISGLEKLEYHTSWKIIEEKYRKTILTDKFEFHIIELPKIVNLHSDNDKLLDWLYFLENPNSKKVIERMKDNKELQQANKKLETISNDEHMRKIAEWRRKAILDSNTEKKAAFRKGIEEGHIMVAKNLLKKGYSILEIQDISGLSKEEIEKLKHELHS